MEPIPDVEIKPIVKGMWQEEWLSYKAAPEGVATWLENAADDTLGYITTRRPFKRRTPASGISISSPTAAFITNQLSGTNGDYVQLYFQQGRDLNQQQLVTSASGTVYSNFFGNTSKNRYDVIQKTLLMTNVGGASAVYYHTGNTTTPAALDTKFPSSTDLIAAGFVGRVWGASSTASLPNLYYSDVIPSGGITSLSTAAQQFLVVNSRNEGITALVQTPDVLFVFTNNYIFRVFNTNSIENAPFYNVGTVSQESITKTRDAFYFYHYSGIYSLSTSGALKKISDPIYYLLKRIKPANAKSVFGWTQDIFVYFYLGQLSGYPTNKYYIVKYNTATGNWSIITTKTALVLGVSMDISEFAVNETATSENWYPPNIIMTSSEMATLDIFDQSADDQSVYGDFNSSGTSEKNINIDVRTEWIDFGKENHVKRISGLSVPHFNAAGLTLAYQIDNDPEDKWETVGALDNEPVTLFRDFQTKYFNRIKFRFFGESYGARMKFTMPTVIKLDDTGYARG